MLIETLQIFVRKSDSLSTIPPWVWLSLEVEDPELRVFNLLGCSQVYARSGKRNVFLEFFQSFQVRKEKRAWCEIIRRA